MEKTQTAVEWLWEKIDNTIPYQNSETAKKFNELLEQAKEMEKEQIIDSFEIGYDNGARVQEGSSIYHGGNYYNETFKKD
jgi:hypothetical protein